MTDIIKIEMRILRLLNFKLPMHTLCAVLFVCLITSPAYSDNQGDPSERLKGIVGLNTLRTLRSLPEAEKKAQSVAEWVSQQKDKKVRYDNPGPEENPLDKLQGHTDPAFSWHEYKTDSKVILNDLTFPQCMEPRLVASGIGSDITFTDGVNALYMFGCMANCINPLDPKDWTEPWQVISYYWPEYQVSVNKAGAQMIDPEIVQEYRADELYRAPTAVAEDTGDPRRKESTQLDFLKRMGLPTELYKDPDWHKAGEEFHLQQDGEVRYPSAMRPNAMWRAANDRPPPILGWTAEPKCLFNALDAPTSQKKIISNRFDQGLYAILARYPETRKLANPAAARMTENLLTNINEYRNSTPTDFLTSKCLSYQLGTNPAVYGDLAKVGVTPLNDPSYKDYCLPGGYSLNGSMASTENTPRLQADAVRVAMAVRWFSESDGLIGKMNPPHLRLPRFTFYEKRKASTVPRYVNFEVNPGENLSNIIHIDKLQRIYPTQPMFGIADGIGGASSEGMQRRAEGQRGSHCFRPEDIPNWSSEGRTNIEEWPLGLVQDVRKHFGETRWAMWNRRVLCSCALDGFTGCLNQNGGDFKNDNFAGGPQNYTGQELPDPFKRAMPIIKGFAEKQGPPDEVAPAILPEGFPAVDTGILGAGSAQPFMPGGVKFEPPSETQPPNPLGLICIPIDGQPKPSGQPSGQPSANPSGSDKKPDFSNPDKGDPNLPPPTSQQMENFYNRLNEDGKNAFNSYDRYNQAAAVQYNCID